MTAQDDSLSVPVWLIGTEESGFSGDVAASMPTEGFTAERLAQLRDGLADLMDTPLVSLEAYPLPIENTIKGGRLLDAASPLATCLTNLIQHSSSSLKAVSPGVTQGGETLYRMVVPAHIATQMGSGLARAMPSAAASTGIHSGILGRAGIVIRPPSYLLRQELESERPLSAAQQPQQGRWHSRPWPRRSSCSP